MLFNPKKPKEIGVFMSSDHTITVTTAFGDMGTVADLKIIEVSIQTAHASDVDVKILTETETLEMAADLIYVSE